MRDFGNNLSVQQIFTPANRTTSTTSSSTDLRGFDSAVVLINVGLCGDTLSGALFWTLRLQHSDDGSSWSACATTDVVGGVVDYVVDNASEDETVYKYGYIGTKRYLRAQALANGTHSVGTPISITALRFAAALLPTT